MTKSKTDSKSKRTTDNNYNTNKAKQTYIMSAFCNIVHSANIKVPKVFYCQLKKLSHIKNHPIAIVVSLK
jgi:hypothetical protein